MAPDEEGAADAADSLRALALERLRQGRFGEAAGCFERALSLQPDCPGTWNNLGLALLQMARADASVHCFRHAVALQPDLAEAHTNLGFVLLHQGRTEEALDSLCRAVALRPELAETHNNLGLARWRQGRREEALASFRRALELQPELPDAWNNLGTALAAGAQSDAALSCFERAVAIEPGHAGALVNLGNAYKDQGHLAEAVACYRSVLSRAPDNPAIQSNLLLAMHYQAGADPIEILAEARRFAERHAAPLADSNPPATLRTLQDRRLRVGYVSADFREHPVASFLEPILSAHDHRHYEIFCYADVAHPDEVTERCRRSADHWRPLVGLSDAQAAEAIRQDGIDLLVDLAGHTGGNRLLAFARRPAPIQASYLGYLGTTGLPAMDYYLTDIHADPPGLSESHYEEQLIRLPECAFCYAPGAGPEVRPEPPSRKSGRVTFGCLNNLAKVTDEVLAVWAWMMTSVPDSRLRLPTGAGRAAAERVRETLVRHGIGPERLLFAGWTATRFEYLSLYQDVDIALDPFPYNGVTTTCDALWMGVPVVALAGRMSVSRQGVRFLRNVGLDELIAETLEDYARIATELAGDLRRLAGLRSGLRARMSRSPLMDAERLTRNLEAAYRALCEKAPASTDRIKGPHR